MEPKLPTADLGTELAQVVAEAEAALGQAHSEAELETWQLKVFGREQGAMSALLRRIPELPPQERGTVGKAIQEAKKKLEAAYESSRSQAAEAALSARLRQESLDVGLPGRRPVLGRAHPIMQTKEELIELFRHFGFAVAEGPEVEDDWHNFTALNTPADHPARDAQDTVYVDGPGGWLLRTHTSSVQIRALAHQKPPLRLVMPGRVYRRDEVTKRHYPIFHQLEALMVEPGTHMGHLKGLLTELCAELFGKGTKIRFRPSYFPFTEPSVEVDVEWPHAASGWMELGGAGMVHPKVLQAAGLDPKGVTALAFGMGIDRVALVRHGVPDIRHLWENDARFLAQF